MPDNLLSTAAGSTILSIEPTTLATGNDQLSSLFMASSAAKNKEKHSLEVVVATIVSHVVFSAQEADTALPKDPMDLLSMDTKDILDYSLWESSLFSSVKRISDVDKLKELASFVATSTMGDSRKNSILHRLCIQYITQGFPVGREVVSPGTEDLSSLLMDLLLSNSDDS